MKFLFVCLILLFLGCEYSNPSQKLNDTESVQKPLQDTINEDAMRTHALSADSLYIDGISVCKRTLKNTKWEDIDRDTEMHIIMCSYKGVNFSFMDDGLQGMAVPDFKEINAGVRYSNHSLDSNTTIDSFMMWFPGVISEKKDWQQAKYIHIMLGDTVKGIPVIEMDSYWKILFIDGRLSSLSNWSPL